MRYFVVVFILVCSVAWGKENAKEIITKTCIDKKGECHSYYTEDDRLEEMKSSLDKIYSMICDLETKFMGNDHMEQITNPDHIPETVRQKRKEYIDNLNEYMKNKKGWIPYEDK